MLTGGSYNKIGPRHGHAHARTGTSSAWNTTSVVNGTYTLQSLATDGAGNTAYSPGITVTVGNTPPTTAVIVPATGATLSGTSATLDASASASNGVGITKVQFVLTGGSFNKLGHRHGDPNPVWVRLRLEHHNHRQRHLHAAEPGHRRGGQHDLQLGSHCHD